MYRSPNRQATVNSMVFRPTLGEFKDLTKYGTHLEKNCRLAEFGFAKIKPPSEWCPIPQESRCIPPKMGIVADYYNNIEIPCPVRQQILGHKKNGFYEIRNHPMSSMTVGKFFKTYGKDPEGALDSVIPAPLLEERDYGRIDQLYWADIKNPYQPVYGVDIPHSLMDHPDSLPYWNLRDTKTILDAFKIEDLDLGGILDPYTYAGTWRSSFGGHTEDFDLFSLNYHHLGAPKVWYFVPPKFFRAYKEFCKKWFPEQFKECANYTKHKSFLIEPDVLEHAGIPVYMVVQEEGDFILTYPAAHHYGFNAGNCINEAVNIALDSWIPYGWVSSATLCQCPRQKALGTPGALNMMPILAKSRPDLLDRWHLRVAMKHPQDPEGGDIQPPHFKSEKKVEKDRAAQKKKRKQAEKKEKEERRAAGETFNNKEFRKLKQAEKAAEKRKEEEEEKKNKRRRKN